MLFACRIGGFRSLQTRFNSAYAVEKVLSAENREKTVAKFASMPPIRMQTQETYRKAAVLIPICIVNGQVSLLYTLRAPQLTSHRGQVSFPGGMLDDSDKTLQHTALRETKEELGLQEKKVQVWGSGPLIVTPREMSVLPVIGQVEDNLSLDKLRINHSEVEEAFTVPLEDLCNPKKIGHTQFRNGYSTPVFLGGPKRIWGLTAIITNIFLRSLLPSSAYNHRISYIRPWSKAYFEKL